MALFAYSLSPDGLRDSIAAHQHSVSETAVKAALLYKFTKFVTWPKGTFASPSTSLRVCVLGKDPFGPLLDQTMAGKTVRGRTIIVQRYAQATQLNGRCHVAYISASERSQLSGILRVLAGSPILSISDIDAFAEHGGMIGLTVINHKIRFAVNKVAADQAGLLLNAQMLNLAIIVDPQGHHP